MVRKINTGLVFAALALAFALTFSANAQDNMKHQDSAKPLETGTFHGVVHKTSGRHDLPG